MARISIDNGKTYITAAEALQSVNLDTVAEYMDDDTREKVHRAGYDNAVDFLAAYLATAENDLIIG